MHNLIISRDTTVCNDAIIYVENAEWNNNNNEFNYIFIFE